MSKPKFYNWGKTHSYTNCLVYFVIGGRSIGKTYGLRKFFIEDFIKNGWRFVELVRTQSELEDFEREYFEKLERNNEFPGKLFLVEKDRAYIADAVPEGETPDWQLAGYFLPLSMEQKIKRRTFAGVRNFCLDEAVIDREISPHVRYLPGEYKALMGIVNTVLREVPGVDTPQPRIHLLGNACDLQCPYFRELGVDKVPDAGTRTFYADSTGAKSIMVHRVGANAAAYATDTTVGKLTRGEQAAQFFANRFAYEDSDFLADMSKGAKAAYNLIYGDTMGVYMDYATGYVYISKPSPKVNTYAIARDDMTIDYVMLEKSGSIIKGLKDLYRIGAVRFTDAKYLSAFYALLSVLGVR